MRPIVVNAVGAVVCAACVLMRLPVAAGQPPAEAVVVDRECTGAGGLIWKRELGTPEFDSAYGVATDAAGNVVIAGATWGSLAGHNHGQSDAFVAKYSDDGKLWWKRQFGTHEDDAAGGVATDAAGNIIIPGPGGFIAYDANGTFLRQIRLDRSDGGYDYVVTADAIVIAGTTPDSFGSDDASVAKYDADGKVLWKRRLGSPEEDVARGVATDAAGDVVIAGFTYGALAGPNRGGLDAFVAKYDASGNRLWMRQLGGPGDYEWAYGVVTDASNNVIVAGQTNGPLGGSIHQGHVAAFVAKYDPDGRLLWTRQLQAADSGPSGRTYAWGVATDGLGNAVIAGETDRRGLDDAYVAKFDASGNRLWTRYLGTPGFDRAWGVATDADGNVVMAGDTNEDAFIAKLCP